MTTKITRWVNFYPPCDTAQDPHPYRTTSWNSRELADRHANSARIACIPVEFCEGDGLNGDPSTALSALARVEELERMLQKRPVAFRVKDFADGWIIFQDEAEANREAETSGALVQGLYARDGT